MGFDAYEDGAEVLQLLVVCVANGLLFQEDIIPIRLQDETNPLRISPSFGGQMRLANVARAFGLRGLDPALALRRTGVQISPDADRTLAHLRARVLQGVHRRVHASK